MSELPLIVQNVVNERFLRLEDDYRSRTAQTISDLCEARARLKVLEPIVRALAGGQVTPELQEQAQAAINVPFRVIGL